MKVFISYCHAQADWVAGRLLPCLKAGGGQEKGTSLNGT